MFGFDWSLLNCNHIPSYTHPVYVGTYSNRSGSLLLRRTARVKLLKYLHCLWGFYWASHITNVVCMHYVKLRPHTVINAPAPDDPNMKIINTKRCRIMSIVPYSIASIIREFSFCSNAIWLLLNIIYKITLIKYTIIIRSGTTGECRSNNRMRMRLCSKYKHKTL